MTLHILTWLTVAAELVFVIWLFKRQPNPMNIEQCITEQGRIIADLERAVRVSRRKRRAARKQIQIPIRFSSRRHAENVQIHALLANAAKVEADYDRTHQVQRRD